MAEGFTEIPTRLQAAENKKKKKGSRTNSLRRITLDGTGSRESVRVPFVFPNRSASPLFSPFVFPPIAPARTFCSCASSTSRNWRAWSRAGGRLAS